MTFNPKIQARLKRAVSRVPINTILIASLFAQRRNPQLPQFTTRKTTSFNRLDFYAQRVLQIPQEHLQEDIKRASASGGCVISPVEID